MLFVVRQKLRKAPNICAEFVFSGLTVHKCFTCHLDCGRFGTCRLRLVRQGALGFGTIWGRYCHKRVHVMGNDIVVSCFHKYQGAHCTPVKHSLYHN